MHVTLCRQLCRGIYIYDIAKVAGVLAVSWYTQIYRRYVCTSEHKQYMHVAHRRQLCCGLHVYDIAAVLAVSWYTQI